MWEAHSAYRSATNLRAWLFSILHNVYLSLDVKRYDAVQCRDEVAEDIGLRPQAAAGGGLHTGASAWVAAAVALREGRPRP